MTYKEYSLHDLIDRYVDNRGKTCPTVKKNEEYLPLIATNCITDRLFPEFLKTRSISKDTYDNWFRGHPEPGDIIIVNKGEPGKTAWVPNEVNFCIAQDMMSIKIKSNFYSKYVFAVLRSKETRDKINNLHVGTMIPHFKKSDFKNLKLNILQDYDNQVEIGDFFFKIMEKIELNTQTISSLEELASTLFKRWFVDFEFPDENGNPYKSNGGEMVSSKLGEIPVGWEVSNLTNIANYKNGLAMQKFRPTEKHWLPVLKIKELNQGFTDNNSGRCTEDIIDAVKVYNGDVIFSWSGTLLVKLWSGGNAGLNQHLFKVTSTSYPKWFYYLWTKFHLKSFIEVAKDKATTMGHIKRHHLDDALVLVPNTKLLESFNEVLSPIIDMIIKKGLEISSIETVRDNLLPKLLSGEVKISDAEVTK